MKKSLLTSLIVLSSFSIKAQTIYSGSLYSFINPSDLGLNPQKFVEYNGYLYFIGNYKSDNKQYLLKSDSKWADNIFVKEISTENHEIEMNIV